MKHWARGERTCGGTERSPFNNCSTSRATLSLSLNWRPNMLRAAAIFLFIAISAVEAQVLQLGAPGTALDKFTDYRFCGLPPKRDPDGTISRSSTVLTAYRHLHPCPATGLA